MIRVEIIPCNPFRTNCYLVWCDVTREAALIDPGLASEGEWQRVERIMREHALTLQYVLLTHSHVDHCMGTGYAGVEVCGSLYDQEHLPAMAMQAQLFGIDVPLVVRPITHDLHEGDVLALGEHQMHVLDCPGHSHHGLCYYLPEARMVFSGDVLFYCSVGRSDFGPAMGCNGRLLAEGIAQKLFILPPDVKVYPGHGPQTTIVQEQTYNPYV